MAKKIARRDFLKGAAAAGVALSASSLTSAQAKAFKTPKPARGQTNMAGFVAPKLDVVRLGFIGVGARGSGHVSQMLQIEGVDVKAIADLYPDLCQNAAQQCVNKGRPNPTLYSPGKDEYKKMLDRDDIDAVIIATSWEEHARMAVDAMNRGKHAFIEVPACVTMDECWQLVDTAERTKRHCMMMENVCYGREELMVLNMCRLGVLGELLHGEAAYIHDLRGQMHEVQRGTGSWRTIHYTKRNGNLYPTHGLGPICQYMGVNRGDRMDYLSSVSSNSRVRAEYAKKNFPPDHKWNKSKFICGDINTSIVRTVNGKTIMIQWDEQLPRPYSRLNLIQGTNGVWGGFPDRCVIEQQPKYHGGSGFPGTFERDPATPTTESWTEGKGLTYLYEKFDHPLWKKTASLPENQGGHGGMDFVLLWRIVYCLRNGLALDQDVYDAATWASIAPLSEWSVAHRGQSVDVPDFTRGHWSQTKALGIVE